LNLQRYYDFHTQDFHKQLRMEKVEFDHVLLLSRDEEKWHSTFEEFLLQKVVHSSSAYSLSSNSKTYIEVIKWYKIISISVYKTKGN